MTDFERLLRALLDGGVELVVIGGFAASAHGSAHLTADLDVVYRRTPENISRLATALAPLSPYLRGAPPGLPFRFDAATIRRGLNFTLVTSAGHLDLLGEAAGNGTYDVVAPSRELRQVFGMSVPVVNLDMLLHLKRAAGRPKDLERIAELEAIIEERKRQGDGGG